MLTFLVLISAAVVAAADGSDEELPLPVGTCSYWDDKDWFLGFLPIEAGVINFQANKSHFFEFHGGACFQTITASATTSMNEEGHYVF